MGTTLSSAVISHLRNWVHASEIGERKKSSEDVVWLPIWLGEKKNEKKKLSGYVRGPLNLGNAFINVQLQLPSIQPMNAAAKDEQTTDAAL